MPEPPAVVPRNRIDEHEFCQTINEGQAREQGILCSARAPILRQQTCPGDQKQDAGYGLWGDCERGKFAISHHFGDVIRKNQNHAPPAKHRSPSSTHAGAGQINRLAQAVSRPSRTRSRQRGWPNFEIGRSHCPAGQRHETLRECPFRGNPAASIRYLPAVTSLRACNKTVDVAMAIRPPTASIAEWSGSWCQRQSGHRKCTAALASSTPAPATTVTTYGTSSLFCMVRTMADKQREDQARRITSCASILRLEDLLAVFNDQRQKHERMREGLHKRNYRGAGVTRW